MTAETDKDYMRVAIRSKEEDFRMHQNADDVYFDKQYDKPAPLRDLLQNNPDDWDNFINGHLGAYIDFQNWLKDQYFNKKDEALVRIVDRAIEEIES